jgi:hypothetical protein
MNFSTEELYAYQFGCALKAVFRDQKLLKKVEEVVLSFLKCLIFSLNQIYFCQREDNVCF